MIRYILISIILLIFSGSQLFSQEQIRYNYGTAAAKIESGNSNMQVSSSSYSTQNLQSGNFKSQQGFLSILASSNFADSLALVDLYNATNPGDTAWVNADGWLTGPLSEWHGVGLTPEGRVNYLDLNNNNLTGALPESLKDLDSLRQLYFYVNPNLEGNLFDFLVNYSKLERVSAHDCSFTGTILPEVFHPGLLEIRVFNNQLTGEIPVEIGNSPLMDQFHVAENQLTGTIPSAIGELKNVRELNLSGNEITGAIPPEIGQMDSLRFLFLENMNLEGEVPIEILNCPSLIEFWASGNNFSGTLPDVLNLPGFRALQMGGNPNILVEIPENIGELTQLQFFSIWNTRPNGGEFPEGFYNLVNLNGLDLSDQQFSGTIDERIGNLSNLNSLYIRDNRLEGAFPAEILSATELNVLDINSNNFDFLPDLSGLTNLQSVYLQNNQLQFESLISFTEMPLNDFVYSPQKVIGATQDIEVSIGNTQEISSEINEFSNTSYQWILNGDSIGNATNSTLEIENFTTAKSGRYILIAEHPDLPSLSLNSAPINLKIAGGKTNWYVDNRAGTLADFRNLNQAVAATKAADTLYIAGTESQYFGAVFDSPRVILGPGYFLEENTETQFNTSAANVGNLYFNATADGSKVYGVTANIVGMNFQSSAEPDTLQNITIEGNRINNLILSDKHNQIDITGNYINILEFSSTTASNPRTYDNILISNNIIDSIQTFFDIINTSKSSLNNVVVNNNTINVVSNSINDLEFNNNIIEFSGGTNTYNNTLAFNESLFTNSSGTLGIDNDYIPNDASLAQGAFSGNNPYKLSGLPPVPSIYNIEIGPRLSTKLNLKSNNENNIARLRYLYRRNNQSSSPFNVSGFNPANELEVEFLPNRSVIQPNETYDLIFQAIDATGKRSHRTYITYEAIVANLSGNVTDIDNVNVNEGNVRLFAINPFANKYDTTAVQALNGSNTFNFENLILGDYIILADPDESLYPNLIPTYLGNTIDWQLAETLPLQQNTNGITIRVEKEPEPLTQPGSEISGFIEEEIDEADSSLRVFTRRRVSSTGVSVRRLGGSSRENNSLRLMEDDYELVAFVKSDENGEFSIPNLPTGDYKIRIEYPGVEVDETSDIDFNLSGELGEVVSVEALVEDGFIKVTETGRVTSNKPDKMISFSFFPNPVGNLLNLKLENAEGANEIIIFDLKGVVHKTIKLQNGQTKVDLQDLATGPYIIRLQDDKGNYIMSKLIKN